MICEPEEFVVERERERETGGKERLISSYNKGGTTCAYSYMTVLTGLVFILNKTHEHAHTLSNIILLPQLMYLLIM